MSDYEFMLDLDGPTLSAFTELIKDHCKHLLKEFFNDLESSPARELSEREKTMAILALVASNSIHVAMKEIITDKTRMPEMISSYVVSSSETTGKEIAKTLRKELSIGSSFLEIITAKGGDA